MKKIMKATVLLAGAWLMQGCGLDNYDEPEAQFSGRVTYQGEPLQDPSNSTWSRIVMNWVIKLRLQLRRKVPLPPGFFQESTGSYRVRAMALGPMIVNPWNLRLRVVSSSILKWCRITCSGIRISRFRAIRSTEFVP